jgi:hypothetical protein
MFGTRTWSLKKESRSVDVFAVVCPPPMSPSVWQLLVLAEGTAGGYGQGNRGRKERIREMKSWD